MADGPPPAFDFVTEVDEKEQSAHRREIEENHDKLQKIIDNLDEKIKEVVKYNQKDFFLAFKNRMIAIKAEMEKLKEKASKEKLL